MSSRFNRFLHLERSRGEPPKAQEQVGLQGRGRFESVQGPGEGGPEQAVPEAHLERFRLQGETPLVLEERSAEPVRFPRCVRCGTTNGRYERSCYQCGADLDSREQLEHDAQLQQAQQEAETREREALQARARAEAERQLEHSHHRADLYEQLRAQVGRSLKSSRLAARWWRRLRQLL